MTQPILDALCAARNRLQPFFLDQLPPQFGQATVWMLQEKLRLEKIERAGVVEDCLRTGCDLMFGFLQKGGLPERPESLYQGLCCHALEGILDDWRTSQIAALLRLLEGEAAFERCAWEGNPRILAEVHRAIANLPEAFGDFMRLCFSEAEPEDVIRERLGLADHEEYLQLSRLSLTSLRNELERRFRTWP